MPAGDSLYTATFERGFSSYVAETISLPDAQAPTSPDDAYYAVALTTASTCSALGSNPTLASFRGRRACHTGYRRTAGWVMPVGYMVEANIMPVADKINGVQQDAESVAEFFSQVCAPGCVLAWRAHLLLRRRGTPAWRCTRPPPPPSKRLLTCGPLALVGRSVTSAGPGQNGATYAPLCTACRVSDAHSRVAVWKGLFGCNHTAAVHAAPAQILAGRLQR